MGTKTTYIYALCDPDTQEVKYIGKSDNPELRLKRHIGQYEPKRTHKSNWIKALLDAGKLPVLQVLEVVDFDNWQAAERQWISYYRSIGAKLTNITDGGQGGKTLTSKTISEAERERRREAGRKRFNKIWTDIKAAYAKDEDWQ